jgi:glycosyltransferase involved in cell wall biosynthesis
MVGRRSGLIFVTQLLDPTDPVLGFVPGLLPALASRCERLVVIGNHVRAVSDGVDAEVVSLGKERGAGRVVRSIRYERALLRLSRDRSFGALFAHMAPVYAALASPIVRPRGMRVALWFAHPSDSRRLALAERLSDVVLTSLPGAYPRKSAKVVAVGQAIDTGRWPYTPPAERKPGLRVLALGRTSPVKGYPVLIRSIERLRQSGCRVQLLLVGPSITPQEILHRRELEDLVRALRLSDAVDLRDGVPPNAVPHIIADADVVVNATQAGSGDKTVFEAMASGRPVLVSNPAFSAAVGDLPVDLMFPEADSDALAERLSMVSRMPALERERLGRLLRDRVVSDHSLDSWAEAVTRTALGRGG